MYSKAIEGEAVRLGDSVLRLLKSRSARHSIIGKAARSEGSDRLLVSSTLNVYCIFGQRSCSDSSASLPVRFL